MKRCNVCAYAEVNGEWPPDFKGTHCSNIVGVEGCHRSWTSISQSHCTVCHRQFGSNTVGDEHRVLNRETGEYECREPKNTDVWETPEGPLYGGRNPKVAAERLAKARG